MVACQIAVTLQKWLRQFHQPSSAGVPLHKAHPYRKSIPELNDVLGENLHRVSLLRVLKSEIRSLYGRIREAHSTGLYQRGVLFPPTRLIALAGKESTVRTRKKYRNIVPGCLWVIP
jgi:hypothetical protein